MVMAVGAVVSLVASVAVATHNVTLSIAPNPANSGAMVTVTATADGTLNQGTERVHIDICNTRDEGVFTNVYQPAANCDAGTGGAVWEDLGNSLAPTGQVTTHSITFDTADTEVDKVGFRARYTPAAGHVGPEEEPPTSATKVDDLTIVYADKHAGCQGIENAYEQVTTKGGGKGNSANALQKVADKLGCDLGE